MLFIRPGAHIDAATSIININEEVSWLVGVSEVCLCSSGRLTVACASNVHLLVTNCCHWSSDLAQCMHVGRNPYISMSIIAVVVTHKLATHIAPWYFPLPSQTDSLEIYVLGWRVITLPTPLRLFNCGKCNEGVCCRTIYQQTSFYLSCRRSASRYVTREVVKFSVHSLGPTHATAGAPFLFISCIIKCDNLQICTWLHMYECVYSPNVCSAVALRPLKCTYEN